MTPRRWTPIMVLGAMVALSAGWVFGRDAGTDPSSAPADAGPVAGARVAAPGRIEGRSETREIGTAVDGVLADVLVAEGERVRAGQVLARVRCDDLQFEARSQRSALDVLRQTRARLMRGGRDDERAAARAEADAAAAVARRAAADLARARDLWEERVIARSEFEHAESAALQAEATARALLDRVAVTARQPQPDELAEMDARLRQASSLLAAAEARVARCTIVSPIDGDVVRVHRHGGEAVSLLRAEPVVTIADTTRLRVRAELDELDVAAVRVGDPASVTAPALGERGVPARVVQVARRMGRKGVLTGDPAEKRDRDVLDVLVELDERPPGAVLGLRVTVVFGSRPE